MAEGAPSASPHSAFGQKQPQQQQMNTDRTDLTNRTDKSKGRIDIVSRQLFDLSVRSVRSVQSVFLLLSCSWFCFG